MDIADRFKQYGYTTNMIYLTLESVEQSTVRVNKRVLDGGHFVDRKNILLNYNEGLQYLERFADRFDNLEINDASKGIGELELMLKIKEQRLVYISKDLPVGVKQTVINIADRYRGNSRDEDNDEEQGRGYRRGR